MKTAQEIAAEFTHAIFEGGFPRVETSVPFAEAVAFVAANPTHTVHKVHGGDPAKFSWGKQWYFAGTNILARIGAGAYGDLEIFRHPDYERLSREAMMR